ncbi:MAG TPA: inner membrane CreD family protein, partial [Opitutaceae bacterium]|nr:inner membrane CreD family protein [Opitutaceae bacterium]
MNQPPVLRSSEPFVLRNAIALKLLLVAFLVILLLVPLGMVQKTLQERLARHDAAVAEITQAWGKSQRLLGPVLVVPYSFKQETDEWTNLTAADGRRIRERVTRTVNAEAYFLPEELNVTGDLDPSERARGIYSTHVYAAKLKIAGRFAAPEWTFAGVTAPDV